MNISRIAHCPKGCISMLLLNLDSNASLSTFGLIESLYKAARCVILKLLQSCHKKLFLDSYTIATLPLLVL